MRVIFGVIFAIFSLFIWQNLAKINTDIFSLLELKFDNGEEKIIANFNSKNDFFILFKDIKDKYFIENLVDNSNLLYKNEPNIANLSSHILALADINLINTLKSDPNLFFDDSIKNIFSPFRILPLSSDFFGFVRGLDLSFGAKFDPKTKLLKTENFYLMSYQVKSNYSYEKLLNLASELKQKDEIYLSSPFLFQAYSKKTAIEQSSYLGAISLVLSILFIWFAFGNFRAFYMIFIVAFSLVCGLFGTLLVLDSLHVLTLVISTSLIGLILDYPLHFLSSNTGKKIQISDIKCVRKTLFIAFFVTAFGYGIFLFSPMGFLHEIAIFSLFSLIGALLGTYFLFPNLIKDEIFYSHKRFDKLLDFWILACKTVLKNIKFIAAFAAIFTMIGIYKIATSNLSDDIKNYSVAPTWMLEHSMVFAKEMDLVGSKFIIVSQNQSKDLVESLGNLIEKPFFVSKFFNEIWLQNEIKDELAKAQNDKKIVQKYENIGILQSDLQSEFHKIISQKSLSPQEVCLELLGVKCDNFFADNKEIIYIAKATQNAEFDAILDKFGANYSDYVKNINSSFIDIKLNAVILKICGFVFCFLALWALLGLKTSVKINFIVIWVSLFCLSFFAIFGFEINIFTIFGLILGSAVGIDYMLFACDLKMHFKNRILGIISASVTSIFSFGVLALSPTSAVFSFGLSVFLSVFLASLCACLLTLRSAK
ncbi:membrane protein, putative transporter [Campylobacter iguaniorum]|uniref:Membrane protein, putative transporter n=1 Tax=Campylobacter iguaniorum TaxID=1244531 RepID=A0A076FC14_9BACT|nr:hypothetical protein [Campylobacter iguaniorum]AII15486.1 membrane protein, putative transporter [Campylobacter iguaniorum]